MSNADLILHLGHEESADGCDLCAVRPLLIDLHAAYFSGDRTLAKLLYSIQDGYGEPGYIPDQGYDWSGIRDSSPDAIRKMHLALVEYRSGDA